MSNKIVDDINTYNRLILDVSIYRATKEATWSVLYFTDYFHFTRSILDNVIFNEIEKELEHVE
jgi:hypothetical protein